MTPPDVEAGSLARATRDALGPQGALAQADPQFVEREVQQQLAAAVADAVDSHATLVAEAGTGVGKTCNPWSWRRHNARPLQTDKYD